MSLISCAFRSTDQASPSNRNTLREDIIGPRCFHLSEWKFISMSALSPGESDDRTSAKPTLGFLGALVLVSSIWLQFIWLAVGSTVKTRDLVKLNNNSTPTAPTREQESQDSPIEDLD